MASHLSQPPPEAGRHRSWAVSARICAATSQHWKQSAYNQVFECALRG
jgi:hypothetical protein